MNKKVRNTLFCFISLIQISIIYVISILSKLSRKRAGVNHHLSYNRTKYNSHIFTDNNVLIMKILVFLLAITFIVLLLKTLRDRSNNKSLYLKIIMIIAIICFGVLLWELSSSTFKSVIYYPYAVFATVLIILLQMLQLFIYKIIKTT